MIGCSSDEDNLIIKSLPISEQLYGKWVIKSGDIIGFLADANCSQTVEFKENRNYVEEVYIIKSDYNLYSYWQKKSVIGNWEGSNNRILLNDWDGNIRTDTIYIQELNDNKLVLKYKNRISSYVRATNHLVNLGEELIGNWYYVTNNSHKGRWILYADGTGNEISYTCVGGGYIPTGGPMTWWTENTSIILHHDHTASGYNFIYSIEFINDTYLGRSDNWVMINKNSI